MKYVLDLKDKVTRLHSDEKDTNETFYRYNITTDDDKVLMVVWFSQKDDGNIYSVYASAKSKKIEKFDVYFNVPIDGPYKPTCWYFKLPSLDIDNHNFYEVHSGMQMLQYVCNTAMQIFEDKEHKR